MRMIQRGLSRNWRVSRRGMIWVDFGSSWRERQAANMAFGFSKERRYSIRGEGETGGVLSRGSRWLSEWRTTVWGR